MSEWDALDRVLGVMLNSGANKRSTMLNIPKIQKDLIDLVRYLRSQLQERGLTVTFEYNKLYGASKVLYNNKHIGWVAYGEHDGDDAPGQDYVISDASIINGNDWGMVILRTKRKQDVLNKILEWTST